MQQVAQLIKADLGMEIAFVGPRRPGFPREPGRPQQRPAAQQFDEFGKSLAAFSQDLGDRMADVCVITMSEFGGGVRGGRVAGTWPGLATDQRYEQRDLAVTTDFRDLFAEVATKQLGIADLASVFPGYDARASRFPGVMA